MMWSRWSSRTGPAGGGLYFELRDRSSNGGEVDLDALTGGRPQPTTQGGTFRLFRIGDAVSSRNAHAAIYDALRLCKDF
jgi:hypothetical protein